MKAILLGADYANHVVAIGVRWIGGEYRLATLRALLEEPAPPKHLGEADLRSRFMRLEAGSLAEDGLRFLKLVEGDECRAEMLIGVGEGGIESDGAAAASDRLRILVDLPQCFTEIGPGLGEVRIACQCFTEVDDRLLLAIAHGQSRTEIIVRPSRVRIVFEGEASGLDRGFVVFQKPKQVAVVRENPGAFRAPLQGGQILSLGVFQVVLEGEDVREVHDGIEVFRIEFVGFAKISRRLIQAVLS